MKLPELEYIAKIPVSGEFMKVSINRTPYTLDTIMLIPPPIPIGVYDKSVPSAHGSSNRVSTIERLHTGNHAHNIPEKEITRLVEDMPLQKKYF